MIMFQYFTNCSDNVSRESYYCLLLAVNLANRLGVFRHCCDLIRNSIDKIYESLCNYGSVRAPGTWAALLSHVCCVLYLKAVYYLRPCQSTVVTEYSVLDGLSVHL